MTKRITPRHHSHTGGVIYFVKMVLLTIDAPNGHFYISMTTRTSIFKINMLENALLRSRGALTRLRLGSSLASVTSKQLKIDANPPMSLRLQLRATPCSCAGGRSRPRRRVRPRLEQPACPCGGRDGRLPSRPPSRPTQGPNWDAPASSSGPLRRPTAR